MSKIVFFCIPAHGHTNPTLGVVGELVERGHEVWYYSYNSFREKIESAGAKFVSCDDYDVEQNLDPKDATRISSTTTFAFNQYSAKIMKQSIREIIAMVLSMPKINKNIKRLQEHGYPVKSVLDIMQNDNNTNTIVYTSPQFQPSADTFSDKYAFVGSSVRPATSHIKKESEKLVYISMGTVNNDMMKFYKNCISAFENTNYQVIMSVGNLVNIEDLGDLPENISVYSHVDQIGVLTQADAFLTHCGMNSVNESLYYQVPLIMYPQTAEQGGVATRVSQLGAGISLEKNNPAVIREAVQQVLENPSYREKAIIISDGLKKCTGAKGAADKILQVLNN